jgi:hypothetical protein
MDNRKDITGPAINMAIKEPITRHALYTNHHMERQHHYRSHFHYEIVIFRKSSQESQ